MWHLCHHTRLCILVHNDTNVKQCAYTTLQVLGAQVQVFHTSCDFIYTKELEDAMQTAIHEAPLPMRLHRQYLMIQFMRSLLIRPDSAYVTGPYPRAAESPEAKKVRMMPHLCVSERTQTYIYEKKAQSAILKFETLTLVVCQRQHFRVFFMSFLVF